MEGGGLFVEKGRHKGKRWGRGLENYRKRLKGFVSSIIRNVITRNFFFKIILTVVQITVSTIGPLEA